MSARAWAEARSQCARFFEGCDGVMTGRAAGGARPFQPRNKPVPGGLTLDATAIGCGCCTPHQTSNLAKLAARRDLTIVRPFRGWVPLFSCRSRRCFRKPFHIAFEVDPFVPVRFPYGAGRRRKIGVAKRARYDRRQARTNVRLIKEARSTIGTKFKSYRAVFACGSDVTLACSVGLNLLVFEPGTDAKGRPRTPFTLDTMACRDVDGVTLGLNAERSAAALCFSCLGHSRYVLT